MCVSKLEPYMLLGLDWVEPMMQFSLHITCSCIVHAYVPFHASVSYSKSAHFTVMGSISAASVRQSEAQL